MGLHMPQKSTESAMARFVGFRDHIIECFGCWIGNDSKQLLIDKDRQFGDGNCESILKFFPIRTHRKFAGFVFPVQSDGSLMNHNALRPPTTE